MFNNYYSTYIRNVKMVVDIYFLHLEVIIKQEMKYYISVFLLSYRGLYPFKVNTIVSFQVCISAYWLSSTPQGDLNTHALSEIRTWAQSARAMSSNHHTILGGGELHMSKSYNFYT